METDSGKVGETPDGAPVVAAAAPARPPAFCRKCDYPLAPIEEDTVGLCPECGRAFDLKNPRTFAPRPGHVRRWRVVRWTLGGLVLIGLTAALVPRGYVVCTLTLTSPSGLNRTITRTQLIPPGWVPIAYPGWTDDLDTSTGVAAAAAPSSLRFSLAAKKRWFDWKGGSRSGGMASASGGSSPAGGIGVNGMEVTPKSAAGVAVAVAAHVASTNSFGVRVGRIKAPPVAPAPAKQVD